MKKLFHLLSIVILLITAISFQSCNDEKYTVWTETETYSQFQTEFNTTLEDGYHKKIEITNEQWKQIAPNLTSEGSIDGAKPKLRNGLLDMDLVNMRRQKSHRGSL